MSKSFRESLPHELVTHITAQCGRPGEEWFDGLPTIIKSLERRWEITVSEPFPGIEFNYVATAVRQTGEDVVIKISPPFEQIEIFGEAAYLRDRNGDGAIRLLAVDAEHQAILLERAFPGKNLAELFTGNEADSLKPAIDTLRAILRPPPSNSGEIVALDDWFDGMRRYLSTAFPSHYGSKALEIYDHLSKQPNRTFYLHGDYHPGNVVNATRSRFLAIDPKGIIGHVGYEIAVFLNNYHWWQEKRPDVRDRLATALSKFAMAFNISPYELRQWAFAQMVLGAWWNFTDTPDLYDNEVVKADIWDV